MGTVSNIMTDDNLISTTTTDAGIGAPSDEFSLSAGAEGPLVLQDHYLIQKMAHFNRERVPEHVVHAKGHGAFGFFEATEDVSQWCKADFLKKGTRTPMVARFSTVAGEQGFPDTVRDPRGFALKFYTQEGNYDLVGNNTPVFFIRDPSKFSDFIHSQKRRADTGRTDHNGQWDFWTLSPESAHQVTILMSDRGTPRTLRHMNGYGSHTFMWVNAGGERFWVKYHFKTEQGVENFTDAEAKATTAEDPDFHRADLWNAIERGDDPIWRLEMQIMQFEDAADYRFNPFDVTKIWPHSDYPMIPIGRMVLDRNPDNYFAQVEQAAFEPSNMVPGIAPSPDKMLQGRLFSYPRRRCSATSPRMCWIAPASSARKKAHAPRISPFWPRGWQPCRFRAVHAPARPAGSAPSFSRSVPSWWMAPNACSPSSGSMPSAATATPSSPAKAAWTLHRCKESCR